MRWSQSISGYLLHMSPAGSGVRLGVDEGLRIRTSREPPIEITRAKASSGHKGECNSRISDAAGFLFKRSLLVISQNLIRRLAAPAASLSVVVELFRSASDISARDRRANIVGVYRLPRSLEHG